MQHGHLLATHPSKGLTSVLAFFRTSMVRMGGGGAGADGASVGGAL